MILGADPKGTKDLSKTIRGTQGFGGTSLEEILNTRTISAVKAVKFYLEFCQCMWTKSLQQDR
jgi:ATP-dependent Zn protease